MHWDRRRMIFAAGDFSLEMSKSSEVERRCPIRVGRNRGCLQLGTGAKRASNPDSLVLVNPSGRSYH